MPRPLALALGLPLVLALAAPLAALAQATTPQDSQAATPDAPAKASDLADTTATPKAAPPAEAPAGRAIEGLTRINDTDMVLAVEDPTGIGFDLQPGWASNAPYHYDLPEGGKSAYPTVGFFPLDATDAPPPIVLNPVKTPPGPCLDTQVGALCYQDQPQIHKVAQDLALTLDWLTTLPGADPAAVTE